MFVCANHLSCNSSSSSQTNIKEDHWFVLRSCLCHIPCKTLPVTWITTSEKVWESDLVLLHAKREISHFRLFRKRITTTCAENRAILSLVSQVGCTVADTITQQFYTCVRITFVLSVSHHQIPAKYHPTIIQVYHPVQITKIHQNTTSDLSPSIYLVWPLQRERNGRHFMLNLEFWKSKGYTFDSYGSCVPKWWTPKNLLVTYRNKQLTLAVWVFLRVSWGQYDFLNFAFHNFGHSNRDGLEFTV